jgi:hypothetical protein
MVAPRTYGDAGGERKAKKMEHKMPSQSKQRTPMKRRSFLESKPAGLDVLVATSAAVAGVAKSRSVQSEGRYAVTRRGISDADSRTQRWR